MLIISVTQLNNFFKGVVDSEPLLGNICVKGEITNYRENRESVYFSLKDSLSQIDCFAYLSQAGGGIANGTEVVTEGAVNFLTAFGKISFFVKKITPQNDLGEQYKKFLLLKKRLEEAGCFDAARKRAVPRSCKKIGVVSSAEGAVIHDIAAVAQRRDKSADIFLYPVKVQGKGAEEAIVRGMKYFSAKKDVDAVILARGGGSEEDLSAFNSEAVVRAINLSAVPVVSAVGHDTDFTLADFAADKRAATPTEAAELVTADVEKARQAALSLLRRLETSAKARLNAFVGQTKLSLGAMYAAAAGRFSAIETKIGGLTARLDANNPAKILSRGLTQIVKEGKIVKNISEIGRGDAVSFVLEGGAADAEIKDIKAGS